MTRRSGTAPMTAYIVRRLLLIVPTLFAIMLINFLIIQMAPGGPVEQIIAQLTGQGAAITERVSRGGGGEILGAPPAWPGRRTGTARHLPRRPGPRSRSSSSRWRSSSASTSRCPSASGMMLKS